MSSSSVSPGQVGVLLATFEGARYLQPQLDSFLAQTHQDWVLLWRDDGSTDGSTAIMERFAAGKGGERCKRVLTPPGRLGACESFLTLLRRAADAMPDVAGIAFADQDDVWLPDKLARGLAALAAVPEATPALYCAQQYLVDSALRHIGRSPPFRRLPGFPGALTQNIATGSTIMLNRAAMRLVAGVAAPADAYHDWWCYLLVTAAGGVVLTDDTPTLLYRQHEANTVGAPASWLRRAHGAARRGPATFMALFQRHVEALSAAGPLLTPQARADLGVLRAALRGGTVARLHALRTLALRRRTWLETQLFRLWFLIGA